MRGLRWLLVAALMVGGRAQEPATGAIAGTVMTADGMPLERVQVSAAGRSAFTDDRGEYRIFGLSAGTYALRLTAGPEAMVVGGWTYPVGAEKPEPVRVEVGTTAVGKDFVVPQVALREQGEAGETVTGRVEEWENGTPVVGALMELKSDGAPLVTRSDTAGEFRFTRVSAGQHTLTVWSAGHLREPPGRWAEGTVHSVVVEAGKPLEGLHVRLLREGVLTGHVTAEGKPVAGAMVSANRTTAAGEAGGLEQAGVSFTDDRGEFRVFGLTPGKYYVAAVTASNGGTPRGPAPVFFPDTARFADAVAVRVGMEGTPMNVELEMPVAKKHTVRGVVRAPDGISALQVRLRPTDPVLAAKFGEKAAEVDAKDGSFVVKDVWPGEYEVVGQAMLGASRVAGVVPVNLKQGDEDSVRLVLSALLRVRGDVRTDGQPMCAVDAATVQVRLGDTAVAHAAVQQDGSFTLEDVPPGSYRVGVSGLTGRCYAKSLWVDGNIVDAGAVPLTEEGRALHVVLGADGGRVRGVVVDRNGVGMRGKRVVMLRAERDEAARQVMTDAQGQFLFEGMEPGGYEVFELSDEVEDGERPDTGVQRVEVRVGEETVVRLKG